MSDLTQPSTAPGAPPLPEPSYARRVVAAMADQLDALDPRGITTVDTIHRAFTVAVASQLHALPTPVADDAAARAAAVIPTQPAGHEHRELARLLRLEARSL